MAGRACGLVPRIHAEQLAHTGAARLAIELQAASADHLEKINRADIRALGLSNVVCTMLPGCCFHLGLKDYAPARQLIEEGAIVGVATDFNPGTSPTLSMTMILSSGLHSNEDDACRSYHGGDDQSGVLAAGARSRGLAGGWQICRPGRV